MLLQFFSFLLRCCNYFYWALWTDCWFIKSSYEPNLNNPIEIFVESIAKKMNLTKVFKGVRVNLNLLLEMFFISVIHNDINNNILEFHDTDSPGEEIPR